ncbi:MAG: hypothetical protein Q9207_002379 [Kuettlingeria erythrocarpa]
MKSLDDLIRHLLEEIALCGDHGAGTSDFVRYVNAYYGPKGELKDISSSGSSQKTSPVDRKFLEKVWEWLAQHPEIEVGENGWASELSLSEVERRTAPADKQRNRPLDGAPSTHPPHQDTSAATFSGHEASGSSDEQPPPHTRTVIRVYASTERRWQAIAGHAPDRDKIPRLDFACLSIIAAHKEQGVQQPDLITISGQDKRSVPERTKRLHEAGYITKTPCFYRHSWTSKLVHTRYLTNSLQQEDGLAIANDSGIEIRPAKISADHPKDFLALQHKIFSVLREVKLITFNELKRRLGVTGLPWPKRLFASHLRRLESIGCIKQVRARPDIEATTPFLFRCVKYVRDPEGKEWQPIQYPSRNRLKDVAAGATEPDALLDEEQDYQLEEAQYLARHGVGHALEEVDRQIPQWSGDGTLSNLLYDLVHSAGEKGLSTMEVKNRSVGCFNPRPTENHLSRLVERWQMSQPLHLRHLSIIRDAALTEGVPHYVHYSFDNFRKLVDMGRASWESVMTITQDHKDFKATASIEAKPELDDDGFPKLPSHIFQGRENDANLTECIRDADALPLPRSNSDPRAMQLSDGTWDMCTGPRPYGEGVKVRSQQPSSQTAGNGMPLVRIKRPRKPRVERSLVVSDAGRPRKVPREGLPPNFESNSAAIQRETHRLQGAARDYRKRKIVNEIERQVDEGGDRYRTIAAVLELAITQHRDAEQEPPWQVMEEVRLAALAPCLMALELPRGLPTLNCAISDPGQMLAVPDYKPSAASHGRPLRAIELQAVEETLQRKILVLETIPIKEEIKGANAHILADAIREPSAKGLPPQVLHQMRPGKMSKRKGRLSPPRVNSSNSNVAMPTGLPKSGKKKSIQKKKPEGTATGTGVISQQYLPSVAAHTRPDIPNSLPAKVTPQVKPVRRRYPKKEAIAVPYLPSIAAHSLPVTPNKFVTNSKFQPKQAKRKYTRKKSTAMPYLPSIAAHSWPVRYQRSKSKGTLSSKRRQVPAGPVQSKKKCDRKTNLTVPGELTPTSMEPRLLEGGFDYLRMSTKGKTQRYLPSIAAHTTAIFSHSPTIEEVRLSKRKLESIEPAQNKRQKKVSWKKAQLELEPELSSPIAVTRLPPPSQRYELQTYEQQLGSISRFVVGCHVGMTFKLAKPGQRGPKRKSQLAVFRSPRIQDLACFSRQPRFQDRPEQMQWSAHDIATNGSGGLATARPCSSSSLPPGLRPLTHPPPLVADTGPIQPHQGEKIADRRRWDIPEQSHSGTQFPSPLHHAPNPLPSTSSNMEYPGGSKRKRSIGDEARRETNPLGPNSMPHYQPMPLAYKRADAVNGQLEGLLKINHFPKTGAHVRSPSQESETADMSRVTTGLHAGTPPSLQDSSEFNTSIPSPVGAVAQRNEDDGSPNLDLLAQAQVASAPGNQPTEAFVKTCDNCSNTQQQAIGTSTSQVRALSASLKTPVRSPRHEPVSIDDQHTMRNVLGELSLLHGVAANDPAAPPCPISKSLQIQLQDHDSADDGLDAMAGSDSLDQLIQDPGGASEISPLQDIEGDLTKPKGRKGVRKMKPHGGSIAAHRQKIVMDIVEKCGGIYPGTSALAVPFEEQWLKSGYSGRAETSTLSRVVKELCANHQLRQVKFVIQDSRGIQVTKSIITKVEISTTDSRVSAMKNNIKSAHPSWYFPDELGYANEVRDPYWNPKGPWKNRTVKDLELDDERVQLEEMPKCIIGYELKEKERQHRTADGELPDHEHTPARRRLASLAKRGRTDRLAIRRKGTTRAAIENGKGEPEWRQGVHKIRLRHSKDSLTFTRLLGIEDFENDFESLEAEERLHSEAVERIMATNAAEGIADESEGVPLSKEPELRTFRLLDNELSTVANQKWRLLKGASQGRPPKAAPHPKTNLHSKAAILQLKTFMDPEHIFHPATGTFHTNFSVGRTANQIRNIYHWQRPPPKNFHEMTDDSERWALRQKGLEHIKFQNWPFISYPFPHRHRTSTALPKYPKRAQYPKRSERQGQDRHSGQLLCHKNPNQQMLAELAAAQSQAFPASNQSRRESASSSSFTVPLPPTHHIPAKRKKTMPPEPFKTRRLTPMDKPSQSTRPGQPGHSPGNARLEGGHGTLPGRRRGEKMSAAFTQRILTAVIVVRTLTGGVERHIDWILVANAFRGQHAPLHLSKTWPKALQAHKVQAETIRTGFEQLFLKAYQDSLVPLLDYDNLIGYDWAWLVDWTIERLDTPLEACLDLPLQRDKLEQAFDYELSEDPGMSAYYESSVGNARAERREAELHKKAWVQPLVGSKTKKKQSVSDLQEFDIVKTWVRASIATKKEIHTARSAYDKLACFDPNIRAKALSELHRDSVIMQLNKGRPVPGCHFGLSQKFLKPLKKKIEAGHLRHAAMFKREIDSSLADEGETMIPQLAEDAYMLAVQNLQAHRRVSFTAKNAPMEKFGLGGVINYRGRQIPKSRYHFDVALQATQSYQVGNPLLPLPHPPLVSPSAADKDKIPLWCNLYCEVIAELWEMVVAAVMSILVTRPGVSIYEVEPSLRPTLGLWEVQMVLDWMVEVRAAGRVGERYVAEEWWWLCLDCGRTFEEDRKLKEDAERKEAEQPREEEPTYPNREEQGAEEDGTEPDGDVQMEDI